ncbi:MAG: hypothetical protein NT007_01695 [Candidatus Kapabacteria bacterium]|nr:hypothetical protein [Candidatus Kapabacteria bacterium]
MELLKIPNPEFLKAKKKLSQVKKSLEFNIKDNLISICNQAGAWLQGLNTLCEPKKYCEERKKYCDENNKNILYECSGV